jgi:hypothetical protein
VPEHAAVLAQVELPDPDLVAAAEIVSAGLFGPGEPPAEARTWADAVIDRAVAAHPVPTKAERRAAARAARDARPAPT